MVWQWNGILRATRTQVAAVVGFGTAAVFGVRTQALQLRKCFPGPGRPEYAKRANAKTKARILKRWRSSGVICGQPKRAHSNANTVLEWFAVNQNGHTQALTQFWSDLWSTKARIVKRWHIFGAICGQPKAPRNDLHSTKTHNVLQIWGDLRSAKARILKRRHFERSPVNQSAYTQAQTQFGAIFSQPKHTYSYGAAIWVICYLKLGSGCMICRQSDVIVDIFWKKFLVWLCGDNIMLLFLEKVRSFGWFGDSIMLLFLEKVHMFWLIWGQYHATFSWKSSCFGWFEDNYHRTFS